MVVTLYPFLNTLAVSFNDAMDSSRRITLWPRKFTLYNYQTLLTRSQIYHATLVSAARTILSTVLGTFCTAMAAYIISRREFVFRRLVSFIYVLTMYIDGDWCLPTSSCAPLGW